jgi:hypothetical protein
VHNSHICFSIVHYVSDIDSHIREFDINLDLCEDNVNGFYAFKTSSFVYNDEDIEAVFLHKTLVDVEDARDKNLMVALRLLDCGTKILVEEPCVPHYFHTHVEQMLEGIRHPEARRAIEKVHNCTMNDIVDAPDRFLKKYILTLPSGVKCKMGYMNPSSGQVLIGSMNVSEQEYSRGVDAQTGHMLPPLHFTMTTITYAIAVDSEKNQKIVRKNPIVGNEADDAFARMSIKR